MSDVKAALKDRIISEFMGGKGPLNDDTRLVDEEIIDSLGIFLMLGFIKERFEVEIDPEDVIIENFETVAAIADLVEKKRG